MRAYFYAAFVHSKHFLKGGDALFITILARITLFCFSEHHGTFIVLAILAPMQNAAVLGVNVFERFLFHGRELFRAAEKSQDLFSGPKPFAVTTVPDAVEPVHFHVFPF